MSKQRKKTRTKREPKEKRRGLNITSKWVKEIAKI